MDIIANKKVENLPFDKTILCTITSVKDKDEGIYEVSANTDSAQANRSYFQAFAQEGAVYEVGDNVYVNVPQNDFSNQKTIISKYISEQAKPVNYVNPMEQFIKLKPVDFILKDENYEHGLKANSQNERPEYLLFEKKYELTDAPSAYECLGISAEFKTLLGAYKTDEGEYGLRFEIGGLKEGYLNDTEHINNYYVFKTVTFSNHDMYGMPYDFFDFQKQEYLINLQDFPYTISAIKCYFYQKNNFKDINGKLIPGAGYEWSETDKTWKKKIEGVQVSVDADIQVKNLTCTFGYLMTNAQDGDLKLYSVNTLQYSENQTEEQNKKKLELRWLLKDEDGVLRSIDELSDKYVYSEDGKIDQSWWDNKAIYLYKYTYGKDDIDEYAGPFWERVASYGSYSDPVSIRLVEKKDADGHYYYKQNSEDEIVSKDATLLKAYFDKNAENRTILKEDGSLDTSEESLKNFPFSFKINITNEDKNAVFARYKIIIIEQDFEDCTEPYTKEINYSNDVSLDNSEVENSEGSLSYKIINDASTKIYVSNEITFENKNEVASSATMALIDGLNLECVDGSNGIYRIYGEDNKISAQSNSQSMKLRANFNVINILGLNTGPATITWYYPKNNTMFVSPLDKKEITGISVYQEVSTRESGGTYYVKVNENYYQIEFVTIKNGAETIEVEGFKIGETAYKLAPSQLIYEKVEIDAKAANWDENIDPNYFVLECKLDDISQIGDSDSIMPSNNEIVYTIDSFYASNRTNNTIKCKIERYGRAYWAEKEFFFGHQGNNGTNYAFDISLEREYNKDSKDEVSETIVPFLKTGKDNFVKVKATLIYGKEEITDSNILNKIRWGWEAISREGEGVASTPHINMYDSNYAKQDSPTGSIIYLQLNSISDLSNYYAILKAEITKDIIKVDDDDESSSDAKSRNVTLSTYLPIGISANNNIQTYIGGTSILYNDYGSDPVYYEGEHQLIGVNNTSWEFKNSDNTSNDGSDKYYPVMYKDESGKNYIRPTTMYFSGINNTGRIVVKNGDITIFVQPIFIAQNAWGNQTINQWDGALKIDSEGNYILSSMIGAGIKNDDNTFSGVLLGQVGKDYDAKTGIYGYGEGIQTYGFREDGTAFIGVSGKSRIEFDGSTGGGTIKGGQNPTLKSAKKNDGYTMTINLSQGSLVGIQQDSHQLQGTTELSKGHDLYINIDTTDTNTYYKIGSKYYDVSNNIEYSGNSSNLKPKVDHYEYIFNAQASRYPLKIGNNFKVSWEGTAYMSNAIIGNAFGDIWDNISEHTDGDISIEEYLYTIYHTLDEEDIKQAQKAAEDLAAEEAARIAADAAEAAGRIAGDEIEAQTRIYEFSPDALYNSVVRASTDGSGNKYIMLANTTYGNGHSDTTFMLDGTEANGGTLCINNLVANGVISGYAGSFGGWDLLPGLMYYGYNTSGIQTNYGFKWIGDFFTLKRGTTSIPMSSDISLETFKNLTYETNPSVEVGSTKAFIFLGNDGNGIGVTKFAGESVPNTGVIQNVSYFLSTNTDKSQPEYGRLKNIIFSLGQNFAVDKDGNLYASNGYFSGEIQANSGKIGGSTGWIIDTNTIKNHDSTLILNSYFSKQNPYGNSFHYYVDEDDAGFKYAYYVFDQNSINGPSAAVQRILTLLKLREKTAQINTGFEKAILNQIKKYANDMSDSFLTFKVQDIETIEFTSKGLLGTIDASLYPLYGFEKKIYNTETTINQGSITNGKKLTEAQSFKYGIIANNIGGFYYYSLNKNLYKHGTDRKADSKKTLKFTDMEVTSSLTSDLTVENINNIRFFSDMSLENSLITVINDTTNKGSYLSISPYTLAASVPSDAKFTDTIYSLIVGNSNSAITTSGYNGDAKYVYINLLEGPSNNLSVKSDLYIGAGDNITIATLGTNGIEISSTGGLLAPSGSGLYAYKGGDGWKEITAYSFFFESSYHVNPTATDDSFHPFGDSIPIVWYGNYHIVKDEIVAVGYINLPSNSQLEGVLQTTAPFSIRDNHIEFGLSNSFTFTSFTDGEVSYGYRKCSTWINLDEVIYSSQNQQISLYLNLKNNTTSLKTYYLALSYGGSGSTLQSHYDMGISGLRGVGRYSKS